jgi:hypothetical protein
MTITRERGGSSLARDHARAARRPTVGRPVGRLLRYRSRRVVPGERGMAVTRWDVLVLLRAAAVAAVALGIAWLVTAVTDEGGLSWGERAGRALPVTPLCSAVGVWGALAPVRARGEALALGALGRSPGQLVAAAVAGGALVALVAALAVGALRSVEVAGFFPTAAHANAWHWQDGGFDNRVQGLRVAADGAPTRLPGPREPSLGATAIPPHGRAAAATTTALSGAALSILAAHALLGLGTGSRRRTRWATFAAAMTAMAASVVLFQAAAVRHVPAMAGALPWLAVVVFAHRLYRDPS